MTFKSQCQIAKGHIDPAPLVDIVFLLLIFLVLSSPFVLQPGIGLVELESIPQPPVGSLQELVVTVNRDDQVFFQSKLIRLTDLPQELHAALKTSRNRELIIKADKQVSHGTVQRIISMAMEAGITAINLAARPSPPAPVAPVNPASP
jgi:biopolymer transport protein ExbD